MVNARRVTALYHHILQHKVRCPVLELADSENRVVYSVPRTHRVCELNKRSFYYVPELVSKY